MENVVVVIGAGQIGQAIARRVGVGKHVMLADRNEANAKAAADVMSNAGYAVSVATVDVSSREAVRALLGMAGGIGDVTGLIHAAGACLGETLARPTKSVPSARYSWAWTAASLPAATS